MRSRSLMVAVLILAIATPLSAQSTPLPPELAVLAPVIPVTGDDGRVRLAYELLLSALDPRFAFARLEVVATGQGAEDDGEVVASFAGAALRRLTFDWTIYWDSTTVLPASGGAYSIHLDDGRGRIIYVTLAFPDAFGLPALLAHRLILGPRGPGEDSVIVTGGSFSPSGAPIALGPPLAGGRWLAKGGLSEKPSHHRIALESFDHGEHLNLPQRFAIDFLGLDEAGPTHRGSGASNGDYPAHGWTVLAVADGIVASVTDSIPENSEPGTMSRAVPMTIATVSGNEVVLELEDGIVARYAHLQPHSLLVREGERVRRGQPIARVGNSGSSMEPHLHFDVLQRARKWREAIRGAGLAARWKAGEGVPFTFDMFELLGPCGETETGEACRLGDAEPRGNALPLGGSAIRFPDRP